MSIYSVQHYSLSISICTICLRTPTGNILQHLFQDVRDKIHKIHSLSFNPSPPSPFWVCWKALKKSTQVFIIPGPIQTPSTRKPHRCNWTCTLGPRSSTKRWPGDTVTLPMSRGIPYDPGSETLGSIGNGWYISNFIGSMFMFDDWRDRWNERI